MLRKIVLASLACLLSFSAWSQLAKDVFPLKREFKNGGFYFAPQATISFGNKEVGQESIVDTSYKYEVIGRGKWGYGIELGWFHSFEKPRLVHFIEGGLAYRVFKGAAEHSGELSSPLGSTSFESDNTFDAQLLVASIRAVNVKQLGVNSFLTTALGANFNYKIADKYDRSASYPLREEIFLKQSTAQLHLQMGVGFRISKKVLMIPTLETPLVTAYPLDKLNPAFPFFSANYHPLVIGLKFMFLREDPVNCNAPVYEGFPGQ